ncbi:MAG: glycosyltransferase family 2 protein [Bacteroidetes bacterium]|nr:glycosyltransferase family 2 protein [Bacteroidota bacterium]
MENKPLVTFITVVYNGASELESTILSILSQTEKRYEYFIIDGGSTDGTVDLIKKYESKLTGWISEKDHGLYDAMNKGMLMGTGQYLWFMNAGDVVYSESTLEKIFASLDRLQTADHGRLPADIIYGETEIINEAGSSVGLRRLQTPEKLNWKSLQWGMVVCHQSFLVKREKCLPYSRQYRFADDIDWMIRVLRNSETIHNSRLILSKFKAGGLSKQNIREGLKERFRIMTRNYGFFNTAFNHLVLGTKLFFYFLRHGRI